MVVVGGQVFSLLWSYEIWAQELLENISFTIRMEPVYRVDRKVKLQQGLSHSRPPHTYFFPDLIMEVSTFSFGPS